MDSIDRYFWFIGGAVMLLNLLIWRARMRPLVARDRITQLEVDRFVKGATAAIVVTSVALGVIGLVGPASPRCLRPFDFTEPTSAATSVVIVVAWAALLWWVWARDGAEFLGRAGSAFTNLRTRETGYSTSTVRIFVTAVVLLSGTGAFLMSKGMPPTPGCPGADSLASAPDDPGASLRLATLAR